MPHSDPEALEAFRNGRRPPGLAGGGATTAEVEVTADLTAQSIGSGDLPVLASPAIVRLVEQAAVVMLRGRLPAELTTVGTAFDLSHDAPTPVGRSVRLRVWLDPGQGRALTFQFTVDDWVDDVAKGSHVRVLVERDRFLAKANAPRSGR